MLQYSAHVTPGLFQRIWPQLEEKGKQAVEAVAWEGRAYAQRLISGPSPSAPGTPPGMITGHLRERTVVVAINPWHWVLASTAHYAPYLELGTWKMAARPFMRPTAVYLRGKAPSVVRAVFAGQWSRAHAPAQPTSLAGPVRKATASPFARATRTPVRAAPRPRR